jgi:hypothetical protein
MKNDRDLARGAGLAGALLLALPILDLLLRGGGLATVRAVVAACGLALIALWRSLVAEKERT